jgi:predicted small secreted protein
MKKDYLLRLGVSIVAVVAILLFSCNAYKGIEKRPPLNTKDTARLANRFKETFKPEPPKYLPGKTITKTVVKEDLKKVRALQSKVDSLLDVLAFNNELLNQTPGIIDSVKDAIRNEILKQCKPKDSIVEHTTIDTIEIHDPKCISDLWLANSSVNALTDANKKKEAVIASYKAERNSLKWVIGRFFTLTWWFWAIIIALVAGYYFSPLGKIVKGIKIFK